MEYTIAQICYSAATQITFLTHYKPSFNIHKKNRSHQRIVGKTNGIVFPSRSHIRIEGSMLLGTCALGLLLKKLTSFVMTAEAKLSIFVTAFCNLIILLKVEPRYLKVSTSSSLSPLCMVLVGVFWLLPGTRVLLSSALIFISFAPDTFYSLVMISYSLTSLFHKRSTSSVKCMLKMGSGIMEKEGNVLKCLLYDILQEKC